MISILLLILPVLLAMLTLIGPKQKQRTAKFASATSLGSLILSVFAYYQYLQSGSTHFVFEQVWITNPPINVKFTVDGIALLLIILTNVCVPFIHLSANNRKLPHRRAYHFLIFVLQSALMGVFLADDLLLYYIFWELTIIPAYFILLYWGGANRQRITFKFFLYTVFGSLMMMVAIIFIYARYAQENIDSFTVYNMNIDPSVQNWLFLAFMLAFAIKLPLIPFHTWQANTYFMAPTQGTMILAGLMAKMALFSIVRWLMPGFPDAVLLFGPIIAVVAVVGVIYAGIIAIMQKDMKRMFAYASLSHVSLMVAGLFSLNRNGMEGAFIQAFSHGINTIGLFICVDIIQHRLGTTQFAQLGGIRKLAPKFTTAFFVMMFATVALPFTNSFIGEMVVLYGIFDYSPSLAFVAVFTLVLGAVYMMRMFRQTILGPQHELTAKFEDLSVSEVLMIFPFVFLVFVFGIVYQPFFELTGDSVHKILQDILIP